MRYLFPVGAVGLGVLAAASVGMAAAGPSSTDPASRTTEAAIYVPVTSDLMTLVIQPRHTKLWLAGKSQNWAFADYERHNIGGALARMATAIPSYKGVAMADLIADFAMPQLADLDTAIKAKNETAFVGAYGALTAGCNGCHQATGHDMVVIKVPDSDPFPDQDFRAPPPR
jgi:hypothetical protein